MLKESCHTNKGQKIQTGTPICKIFRNKKILNEDNAL